MIEIVAYRSSWPREFADEAARIRAALGARARRIDHVGSTAVPGLAAKPVIDIQLSVQSLEPLATWIEALDALGYRHVPLGDFDALYPYFKRPDAWPHTHHVHVCEAGGEQERRHLAFRDWLRRHPAAAAEYVVLKRELARLHRGDTFEEREQYSLAKDGFVEAALERAYAEGLPTFETDGS
jgi:GrpB-like predicted nucleotidyltransferase (UPF0157 family)